MGNVGSRLYSYGKRIVIHYNAENRAHKFLDKGQLPPAPRHEIKNPPEEVSLSREALEDIHCKNVQLNEYLKKVYLTSTSEITGTPSKKPKPKKENERLRRAMFYEPQIPKPGFVTLTNAIEILLRFEPDSDKWSVNAIAKKFNLDKNDVVHLVTYYSLYRDEKLDFMNERVKEENNEIALEINTQLEKKPVRKIDSK